MAMISDTTLALRAPEPDDVDALFLWENDPDGSAGSAPFSRHQVWQYVHDYDADPLRAGELRLIVTDKATGTRLGHIDLTDIDMHNRRAAVGIYIAPEHRRKGHAAGALRLLSDYARGTLGLHQLWAHVAAYNRASLTLFTSCGFKPAGRLRSWLRLPRGWQDVIVLQKLS